MENSDVRLNSTAPESDQVESQNHVEAQAGSFCKALVKTEHSQFQPLQDHRLLAAQQKLRQFMSHHQARSDLPLGLAGINSNYGNRAWEMSHCR